MNTLCCALLFIFKNYSMKQNYFFKILILISVASQFSNAQTFEEVLPPPSSLNVEFADVSNGSVAFADIDGDNDDDVLISGIRSNAFPITKL